MNEIPTGRPLRARRIPRFQLPEVEIYRLGEGMAELLDAAAWIARRSDGHSVPYCDDTGFLLRHTDEDGTWNQWFDCGAILAWTPPGPDGGLYGEFSEGFFSDYDLIDENVDHTDVEDR